MKIINKIVCCLTFLLSFSTFASKSTLSAENDNLITKMSLDNNVKSYLINGYKSKLISFSLGKSYKNLSVEDKRVVTENMKDLILKRNQSLFNVYSSYPELEKMSIIDRQEIFKEVFNSNSVNVDIAGFFKCLASVLGTYALCIEPATVFRRWAFTACTSAAAVSNLVIVAANPEELLPLLDTGIEVQLVEDEVEACADITSTVKSTDLAKCAAAFSTAIATCISIKLK
jgi:hypothetical protein